MPEEKWRLVRQQTLGQDKFVKVRQHDYELPDGSRMEGFYLLEERTGVNIVAVTAQNTLLLVRQYRAGMDSVTYECPAGFLEDGEDALHRAKRELLEETGHEADTWHSLGTIHPAPHRMKKTDHYFLALGARQVTGQDLDSTEFVQFKAFPVEKIWQMIRDGEITSATSIALLFKARLFMENLSGN